MAKVFRRQVFTFKHMAEVGFTVRANYFRTAPIRIRYAFNRAWNFVVEAGPSAVRFKFVPGCIQWRITTLADVHSIFPMMIVFARVGILRSLVNDHAFLLFG